MSDFDAWIDWEAAARAAQAEQAAREQAEINQTLSMYTPSQNLGKIEGLPTNPLDPNTASLGYKQGAYSYDGYWGQPVWSQGNIVGYEFVKHDITPGMMSVIRTDTQGNIANTQLGPEGEGITLKDAISMAAPYALMAFPGLGQAIGASLGATGTAATALGNAVIGGTLAEASGGDFVEGALASGAGSLASGYVAPELSSTLGSEAAGRAITGGLLAEAKGGDFLQGAASGAISGAAADAKLAAAEEYLASQPSGYGAYESNLPTEQSVLDAIAAEQPTFTISDTTFKPDYSLTTGAPVIPEMGAQGIQVPTINEVIDVVNQPVDYSLPIPNSGLDLQMPTAPNLESMGGGQGITVPVSGGVLTEAGVIPSNYSYDLGDPNSFINQPAPDSDVKIEEVVEKPMTQEELTKKLSEIDLAKTAANLAAGALAAGAVANLASGSEDTQTGYEIVPIPADWTSPVYASTPWQAPTPIDFGSRELLKGTQWENPVSLSSLINSMNVQPMYEMPDFMQTFNAPTTVATTDIIGNLNDKPMSISDIISGIQSGQTYSS